MKINLWDENFSFTLDKLGYITASDTLRPSRIEWLYKQKRHPITVFTDLYLNTPVVDQIMSEIKIAWLVEPKSIFPFTYEDIIENEHKFDYIFTHDEDLLNRSDKYKLLIMGQSRIEDKDAQIYPKTKTVSMIASHKMITEGHKLRHQVKGDIDRYGHDYINFDSKLDPLKDYMFSICIMNSRVNNFFTEVLTDPIRTGAIPIFWGCPNIGNFFDKRGIIEFSTLDELYTILPTLTKEKYRSMLPFAYKNLLMSNNYVSTEDSLFRYL